MKIGVISDIHANFVALEAMLAHFATENVQALFVLGDMITDCPYPRRTMELLYGAAKKMPVTMIRGNREQYIIDQHHDENGFFWKPSSSTGALLYTAKQLGAEYVSFFEALPLSCTVCFGGLPPLTLCHASPVAQRDNLYVDRDLMRARLEQLPTPYLLGGHSHAQEKQVWAGKTYLNPGSLGLARDGVGGNAQAMLLCGSNGVWSETFISIPYDVETLISAFEESGLNAMSAVMARAIKKTATTGVNYFILCFNEALRLSGTQPQDISEEIWQQAAQSFDI